MNNKQIIKLLKSIHTKNNSLLILDNILIDKDTIKITNLNNELHIKINPISDIPFLVKLSDFEILYTQSNTKLSIIDNCISNGSIKVPIDLNITDYPVSILTNFENIEDRHKEQPVLLQLNITNVKRCLKYVCNDELKPRLSSLMIYEDLIAGTDAHSVYFVKHNSNDTLKITLNPKINKFLNTLDKGLYKFQFTKINEHPGFEYNDHFVTVTNADNEFILYSRHTTESPNIKSVIPVNHYHALAIDNTKLKKEINNILSFKTIKRVELSFDVSINNTMKIYANDLDNKIEYTTYIDFIYQKGDEKDYSPEFKIALNPKQLINILNECNGVVRLELNSFNKVIKIDDNFLLMPMPPIN